jgi:hypothetical protein
MILNEFTTARKKSKQAAAETIFIFFKMFFGGNRLYL